MDIFDWIDCEDCPRRVYLAGEAACEEGDFGQDYPCGRMTARIEEGLRDGDFDLPSFQLVPGAYLTGPDMRDDYEEIRSAHPRTDWQTRLYWQVFRDGSEPKGFDSAAEVCAEVFYE